MKSHVWRPLFVVLGALALAMVARYFIVPRDFGVGERGFMYSFHRMSNEDEWKAFKVKYQGKEYCGECHEEKYEANMGSKHKIIQCENCHGPAIDHPEDPEKLTINRSRALCIRCHAALPYPTSHRKDLPAIDPAEHNPDEKCAECHDPHEPDL
jgi:predicted CXXCH cytochrome family protein